MRALGGMGSSEVEAERERMKDRRTEIRFSMWAVAY